MRSPSWASAAGRSAACSRRWTTTPPRGRWRRPGTAGSATTTPRRTTVSGLRAPDRRAAAAEAASTVQCSRCQSSTRACSPRHGPFRLRARRTGVAAEGASHRRCLRGVRGDASAGGDGLPAAPPVVAGIVVGMRSAEEARRNAEAFGAHIPAQVWADLRAEGLSTSACRWTRDRRRVMRQAASSPVQRSPAARPPAARGPVPVVVLFRWWSNSADPAATIGQALPGLPAFLFGLIAHGQQQAPTSVRCRVRCDDGLGDQYRAMQGLSWRRSQMPLRGDTAPEGHLGSRLAGRRPFRHCRVRWRVGARLGRAARCGCGRFAA